jgi:hypothetical protein
MSAPRWCNGAQARGIVDGNGVFVRGAITICTNIYPHAGARESLNAEHDLKGPVGGQVGATW